jgi:hypothetical protein
LFVAANLSVIKEMLRLSLAFVLAIHVFVGLYVLFVCVICEEQSIDLSTIDLHLRIIYS